MVAVATTIQIPQPPRLKCNPDGSIDRKQLDAYFRSLAQIPNNISLQILNLSPEEELALALIVQLIEAAVDPVTTKPFSERLKSLELDLKYRMRELSKDLEEYLKIKVVEILLGLIEVLGIPNPFTTPIPFIGRTEDGYDPLIIDLFTKDGQKKVKEAAERDIERVKKFFADLESTFNGDLGVKSPDLETEETWHKIKNWFSQRLNEFIGNVSKAIANSLRQIPIIGEPIYKLVVGATDPTVAIEDQFDALVKQYKKDIKEGIDKVLSGEALENVGEQLLQEVIDKILDIPIPLLGTVRDYVDVDIKGKGVVISELNFHDVEDKFKELIQKARRFFEGDLLVKIYGIIEKAPKAILRNFPIVGQIFKALETVVDILSGKNPLTDCDILNIIFPVAFGLLDTVLASFPPSINIEFVE